jgi:D-amino-acid oxidase
VAGWRYETPVVEMPVYLDYLLHRFVDLGGEVRWAEVAALADARAGSDLVVNCAGIGARALASDPTLRAAWGQHVVVQNPGRTEFFAEDAGEAQDFTALYPHGDALLLGGIAVEGMDDREPDEAVTAAIIDRCAIVDPRVADARVLEIRVGLRPVRPTVRLDLDTAHPGHPIIHNYGHGGAGISLSWGCARAVRYLARTLPPAV